MKSTSKMTKALLGAGLILLLTFTLVALVAAGAPARDTSEKAPVATKQRLIEAYAKLPLSFESNQGQTNGQVKFLSRGSVYTLFLTPTEVVLVLSKPQNKPSAVSHQPLAKPTSRQIYSYKANADCKIALRRGFVAAAVASEVKQSEIADCCVLVGGTLKSPYG